MLNRFLFFLKQIFTYLPKTSLHNVFIYGHLKQGELHHNILADKKKGYSHFIGCGETLDKYPLILVGDFKEPCLLQYSGVGHNVRGEIYEVDDKMLDTIDLHKKYLFERYPELIRSTAEENRKDEIVLYRCWVYFLIQVAYEPTDREMLQSWSSSQVSKSKGKTSHSK